MTTRRVYLDHQATTPVLPEVREAMRPFFTEAFGSPSSLHQLGLQAREALAQARAQVAGLINASSPDDILFTAGGTESANLAVKGVAYANQKRGNHLVVSAIEHPAVLNSVEFLEKQGFHCTRVKVDGVGRVDPEAVRAALTDQTILVCVHQVNHDIGTIEPIAEISRVVNERGVPLFVDATASGGWLPLDVQALGVSLVSLSPHRFYGPKGVGILYRHRRARLVSILHGGVQEGGRRAGTENLPGIVGAGVACAAAQRELSQRQRQVSQLQQRLWNGLKTIPHLRLNGPELGPGRSPTNLNVSPEFIEGEGLLLRCDVQGLAIASGTSCVSKSLKISHVLSAIGLELGLAQASVLLSVGKDNTPEEIDAAIAIFTDAVKVLRQMSPLWDEFQRGQVRSAI